MAASTHPLNLCKACLLIAIEEEAAEAASNTTTFSMEWTQLPGAAGLFATLLMPDMRSPAKR